MIRRLFVILAVAVACAWPAAPARADAPLAAPVPQARPGGLAPSDPRHGVLLRERHGLTGRSGWLAVDLATGEVVDAHDADGLYAPASVAKLATALFALSRLGTEHRFETRLIATGEVRDGTLEGDLALAGGGDPELDTDALAELVDALAARGITRMTGRFLVDRGWDLDTPAIDAAQPVDVSYNPSVSGLNLNFNRVLLRWGRQAGPAGVSLTAKAERLDPPVGSMRVEEVPRGGPLAHILDGAAEVWRIARGALRGEGSRWLPVKRPALYAGDVFRTLAGQRGIVLPAPEAGEAGGTVLARRSSRPLGLILHDMLRYSTNLTAEVVGAAAAMAGGHAAATLKQSAAMMNAWLAHVAGYSPGDPRIRFVNHSGLSVESRVAPSRLVALLRVAAAAGGGPPPGPAALLLSPHNVASAEDGIDHASLEVRAKTGTMDRIRGLAGYVSTPGGRDLAFAIFSNDLAARGEARRGVGSGWMNRARAFERALIRSWVVRADAAAGDGRRVSR